MYVNLSQVYKISTSNTNIVHVQTSNTNFPSNTAPVKTAYKARPCWYHQPFSVTHQYQIKKTQKLSFPSWSTRTTPPQKRRKQQLSLNEKSWRIFWREWTISTKMTRQKEPRTRQKNERRERKEEWNDGPEIPHSPEIPDINHTPPPPPIISLIVCVASLQRTTKRRNNFSAQSHPIQVKFTEVSNLHIQFAVYTQRHRHKQSICTVYTDI